MAQTQSREALYDMCLTSPSSFFVCVCFIHITSLLVMVTFALPSEQDPLVFEKVGPKISVGLVGLIKVHFSSINSHYLEKKKKRKTYNYNLQELRYLNPFQIYSVLFLMNQT